MVKVAIDTTENAEPAKPKRKTVRPRRKSRWLLKLSLTAIALIIAAPSLISLSGQAPAILNKIHPKLASAVSFQRITLHWWAPVELQQLQVRDLSVTDALAGSGQPLLCEVERVATVELLWRIALNAGRGTGIVVRSPRLNLIVDERGTNIDRTVTAVFGESTESESPRFPFRITIEDGAVELRSALSTQISEAVVALASDSADVSMSNQTTTSAAPEVTATVTAINGTFSTMDTERWLPGMKLTASINQAASATVSKRSGSSGSSVSRPARLAAGLDDVVSDFPDVPLEDLAGTDESGDATGARILIHLNPRADEKGRQTIQFGARDVDLKLLQPFLSMLGMNAACDGIISGGIDARLAGANLTDGIVGRLMLQGQNIRVREHSWAHEEWLGLGTVDASGAVAIAEDGMLIQNLNVRTEVAELTGSGELRHHRHPLSDGAADSMGSQQVEIKGSIDLARLTSSLRETLAIHHDLTIQKGRLTFGLKGSAGVVDSLAETTAPQNSGATAANSASSDYEAPIRLVSMSGPTALQGSWQLVMKTEDLAAIRAGTPLNIDPGMRLDAVGPFKDGLPELSRARLTANFGTIDCAPDGAAWKILGLVQPVSLWQQLQQFADLPKPGLRGDLSFQSRIALQGEAIQLTDLQLNSSDVKATSAALAITPSSPLTSMLDGTIHVEGTGAALRTLLAPWHDASWLAENARVVTDLTASASREIQLAVHVSPPDVAAARRPHVLSVSGTTGRPVSNGIIPESAFVIDEADVALSMIAKESGRLFEIQNGSVKIPGVVALIKGSVSVPNDDLLVDVTADTSYDLDVLSRRLFTPNAGLMFSGQGRDAFRLTGSPSALTGIGQASPANPAAPATLKGSGTIKWVSADVMGLQVGPATVQAMLENNLLRSEPVQCMLNGGQLNVMPQYDLSGSRLQLGTGSRVQRLQLTPDLCRNWLGYVAPMIADSAEVSGEISVRVERFLWDVYAPQNSDVMAQLTIHRAEASAGSSLLPLLEVVDLLRRRGDNSQGFAERSLILPEQTVPVQVRQGYVIHDGLVMELNGYRLRTAGAVGLNEQLQMTIDVPLEKTTAAGNGRSVKIPLRGTISQPQPDTAALLQNLGTQKIQQKLDEQVDKTLNKQLNKLFDKF